MNSQRIENLALAVRSLREYVEEPVTSKRDLAGTVFGFVMAFELAWKCVQDRVIDLGYTERGPRLVLEVGLTAEIIPISEEAAWSQILEDRNLESHIYNQQLAGEVVERIGATHLVALETLVNRLRDPMP